MYWDNFKLRLYLETTTFKYFYDERKGHEDVVRLFEAVKAGQFAGYTSQYVIDELYKAEEPKRTRMIDLLDECHIISLTPKPKTDALAKEYIDMEVIPKSQFYDSLHIAAASLYGLDVVVSYNFKHINREKTQKFIPFINIKQNLKWITFCTAEEVFYIDRIIGRYGDGSNRG